MQRTTTSRSMLGLLGSCALGLILVGGLLWALIPRPVTLAQSVNPGFTIDLFHHRIWGQVGAGDVITVERQGGGYGAAQADGAGFFWTPLWDAATGSPVDIQAGDLISLYVNGAWNAAVTVYDVTGQVDVLNDQVTGNIAGVSAGTRVTVTLQQWGSSENEPRPGTPQASTTTDGSGNFTVTFAGIDLAPHQWVAVDYPSGGGLVRAHLVPQYTFIVHSTWNSGDGFAQPGQVVTTTIYTGTDTLAWELTTTANQNGLYTLRPDAVPLDAISLDPGDLIEVDLGGGVVISTVVAGLTAEVDADTDVVNGTASPGATVRVSMWQWDDQGEYRYYQVIATADGSGQFTANLSSLVDVIAWDTIQAAEADAEGNETVISFGAPFIQVSLDEDWITTRVDQGGVPITATLNTGSQVYTWYGHSYYPSGYVWNIQFDSGDGPVDIEPGHIITVESPTWQGEMTAADIEFEFDVANDQISGQMPAGYADVRACQWADDRYPINGCSVRRIAVTSPFTVDWSDFDLRWSSWVGIDQVSDGRFVTHMRRDLPFIEANLTDGGVGGWAWVPGEQVTGVLYESDGVTIKAITSQDFDDHPLNFWLGDWSGEHFAPGDWITVTGGSGWETGVQVVEMSISGDETTERLWGDAPTGLLYLHWDNQGEDGADEFVPTDGSGSYAIDWSAWGKDLEWGHTSRAYYLSPSGNQVSRRIRWPQIVANYGPATGTNNHVWGQGAGLNAAVRITVTHPVTGIIGTAEITADGWGNFDSQDALPPDCVLPGNEVEVDFGNGIIDSMTVLALYAEADVETDVVTVTAPVGTNICEINFGHHLGGGSGLSGEIGASGYLTFNLMTERGFDILPFTFFNIHSCQPPHNHNTQYSFRTSGLQILVDYADNWVSVDADPHTDVTIVVAGKATLDTQTDENGHFESHWRNDLWAPEMPDIEPGDIVTVTTPTRTAEVNPVGLIEGASDVDTDIVAGTLHAPWFSPTLLMVRCEIHEENGPAIDVPDVDPDGGAFECDFGSIGWDITPGQNVAVHYVEPDGDRVQTHLRPPVLRMNVNYGHDWVEGNYEAGHTVWITVTAADQVTIKGTAVLTTGQVPWWGGQTGFSTSWQGWQGDAPDIVPGDWVYGLTDEGLTSTVQVGTIAGFLDVDADLITGTIDASWIGQEVQVDCHPWGAPGGTPVKQDWVWPNGTDVFTCSWAGEWDIGGGQDVGVFYYEPDNDQVGNAFRHLAPHVRIRKSINGSPGEGGNVVFQVQYENNGQAAAADTVITDTMLSGLTYITDTLGLSHSGTGAPGDPIVWDIGTLPQDSSIQFEVYAAVTGAVDEWITNTIEIATSDPYDEDRPWEYNDGWGKSSTWEGQVQANDTHLNIGKGSWTGDPAPDTDFVYWVNACNNGSTASSALTITDTLPLSLTLVSWWGQHSGWSEVSSSDHELVVRHPSLPGGWCSQVYVRVHLGEAAPGDTICNTAVLTASNDLESDDNEATDCCQVGDPHTNLNINKMFAGGQLVPGGQIRYSIDSHNNGNMPVTTAIRITDTLPAQTTFVGSWWYDESGEHPFAPVVTTSEYVVWELPGLDNGYGHNFQVVLNIDPQAAPGDLLTNTVTISPQPVEDNEDDNTSVWVEQIYPHGPNLRVRKWGSWDNWGPGTRRASYNVTVENVGDAPVDTVVLTDTYPADMRLDGGVGLGFWQWWDWQDHPDEHYFTVTLELMEPGWSVGMNFSLITDTDPLPWGLIFTNTVHVSPLDGDTNPDDNSDQAVLTTGPDLYVEKTLLGGQPLPGELITFTLRFGNQIEGWQQWWNAQGNTLITDTLTADMTYVTSTLRYCEGPECPYIVPSIVDDQLVFALGPQHAGGWNEIDVVLRITDTVTGLDTLINRVEIASDQPGDDIEPWYGNNTAQIQVPVALPYLQVSKTYQSSRIAGTPLTYTLAVVNSGHGAATQVELSDTWQGHTYTWTLAFIDPYTGTATAWLTAVVPCSGQVVNDQYLVTGSDQGVGSEMGAAVSFAVVAPTLLADFDQSASALLLGHTLYVTDTSVTNGAPIAAWHWDFGDDSTASTPNASHIYAAAGSYVVTLTVTDTCGYNDTTTWTVQIDTSSVYVYLPVVLRQYP